MGCCFSSDNNKDPEFPEPDERTRLLDPDLGGANGQSLGQGDHQYNQDHDKGDEQSVMARILHQNAREVIDVASADNTIEQNEYHDRTRLYSNRIKSALAGRKGVHKLSLPQTNTTSPMAVLAAPPITLAEIQLVSNTSEKLSKAMRDVRIQHREDLVVSFLVPMP